MDFNYRHMRCITMKCVLGFFLVVPKLKFCSICVITSTCCVPLPAVETITWQQQTSLAVMFFDIWSGLFIMSADPDSRSSFWQMDPEHRVLRKMLVQNACDINKCDICWNKKKWCFRPWFCTMGLYWIRDNLGKWNVFLSMNPTSSAGSLARPIDL